MIGPHSEAIEKEADLQAHTIFPKPIYVRKNISLAITVDTEPNSCTTAETIGLIETVTGYMNEKLSNDF